MVWVLGCENAGMITMKMREKNILEYCDFCCIFEIYRMDFYRFSVLLQIF